MRPFGVNPGAKEGRVSPAYVSKLTLKGLTVNKNPNGINGPLASVIMSDFGRYLENLVLDRFGSRRKFIIAAEGEDRAQAGVSYFSQVVAGKKPPPLHRLEAWADALGLQGAERERFVDLACIEHLPEEVRPRFRAILSRLEAIEKRLSSG